MALVEDTSPEVAPIEDDSSNAALIGGRSSNSALARDKISNLAIQLCSRSPLGLPSIPASTPQRLPSTAKL